MLDAAGNSIFGAIEQRIEQAARPEHGGGWKIPVDDGIVLYTYWRSSAAYRVLIAWS
jgi:hypothetical protein